ncbi:acetolactate synthase, large subunit [Limimonas halophila]|uniref:Acetolactate synthase, large subunit n=1 Tax=Limimonas halophila TaxID=1082479 RepID=A0A1G7NZS0_9PROT|nr:thiamine pyrophosphate-binding protein [Limimonas halophila]SDF79555.1 acetolactate synthase, large subunit [Limimonas halophila]
MTDPRMGGRCLVDQFVANGVERVFCVPGESYLAALDALHDTPAVDLTVARHEGGAAMMAEAHGKLTGQPGICFVTRGPGATNAASGVHVAQQDATPLIVLVGQVARRQRDRGAFQDLDISALYGGMAKWTAEVDDPHRIPELFARAVATATSGRPGPVALALPEDVLTAATERPDVRATPMQPPVPAPEAMTALRERLAAAERPIVIAGGPHWSERARAGAEKFAKANDLPLAVAFRRQDAVDNDHPCYAGELGLAPNPELAQRVRESDLVLAVGTELGDVTTGGHGLIESPGPRQTLIHVHPADACLGRVHQAALALQADPACFFDAANALAPIASPPWAGAAEAAHAAYRDWIRPLAVPGEVQLGEALAWLAERLPEDAVVTNGAGNYAAFVGRYMRFRRHGTQLAPTSGSMGYGLPAAIAAKLHAPDRPVIAFAGDGCFQMTAQEMVAAVQAGASVVVIVVNNRMHGTIRMHQEKHYPGRPVATDLHTPDFAAQARAQGAHAETVTETGQFAPAVERALAADGPTLIEVRTDPEAITPQRSLSAIRAAALGQKAGG